MMAELGGRIQALVGIRKFAGFNAFEYFGYTSLASSLLGGGRVELTSRNGVADSICGTLYGRDANTGLRKHPLARCGLKITKT